MKMITGHQIRAARALLDWGAERLAEEANLNRDTVHNIENGKVQARGASAERIMQVFTGQGIEFIGDRGVAFLHDNYRILEGPDCYLRLLDEVYHTLRGKPGAEVLSICTDDSVSPPEVVMAIQRWHEAGIKCRFLSHENATRFDFPLEEYRLISSRFFKNSVMVIFANKVATLRGVNDTVLVVNDKDQTDMLRGLFELIWGHAAKPATKTPEVKTIGIKKADVRKPQARKK
jgi:DNA-binding XRE family transcriptional regulator